MPTNAWGDPMRRPVNGVNVNIKIQTEVTDEKGDVKDEYLDPQLLCMAAAVTRNCCTRPSVRGTRAELTGSLGTCQLSSTSYLATVWRRFPTWSTTIPFSS